MSTPDPTILGALRRMRLIDAAAMPHMAPLSGGVSSDIWRVDLADGPVCVKRALARLKVDACWEVAVERNSYEWAWMCEAARVAPGGVPPLLGHDPVTGCFAMGFLDPKTHPVWKSLLRQGIVVTETAVAVGRRLVALHAATADRPDIAAQFATDHIFQAIRLDPYLLATATRHPALAPRLRDLAARTAATKRALVHGDVSPKNVLVGMDGPVFLDAECAWYGDPAFDLAFCLNHLLLKCRWTPSSASAFLEAFDGLRAAYLDGVTWEAAAQVEGRAAHLLPGLLLARVDGKSPVEYLTTERDRSAVRRVATALLRHPTELLDVVRATWAESLGRDGIAHGSR